jgi:hypothetical protein
VAGALALAATLAVAAPASADVTAVSFDGESGTLAGVSASAGATVSSAAARHGTNGLDVDGMAAPAFARWNPDVVPQGHTHATARVWIRLLSRAPGESVDLFTIQSARRTENFDLFVNGITGQLQWDLYRANEDHTDGPMELGRWYLVEVQVEYAGDEYTARVRLDGVDQGTIASAYPSTTVRSIIVGSEPAKTHHQQYDDLVVQVGDAPTGWPVTTTPVVTVDTPTEGATFARDASVPSSFHCDGPDFAVVSCDGPATVDTSTVGAHSFTVTATDTAGQQTVLTRSYTVVDVTDPSVELRRPVDGATYGRGEVVEADLACEDEPGGSGVASCTGTRPSGAAIDTSSLGEHEFTATAVDAAGNSTSVTHHYTVADRTSPTVVLATPGDGTAYARGDLVLGDYSCFDEIGGTGLRPFGSCVGPVSIDAPVDTWTLGSHDFTVTATDAAGNVGWTTNTYEVLDNQPDNQIANAAAGGWVGDDVRNAVGRGQTRVARVGRGGALTYLIRVQNDTGATDRFHVQGGRGDRRWQVSYRSGGRNVTAAVTAGRFTVGPLAPGQLAFLRVVVRPTRFAHAGDQKVVRITSSAVSPGTSRDTVVAVSRRG